MKQRGKQPKRISVLCMDGPWAGRLVKLPSVTLVFTVGGHTGKYVDGRWEDVRKTA